MQYVTRRVAALCLGLLVMASPSFGNQKNNEDGSIVGTRPYKLPTYDDAHGYTRMDGSQDAIDKYWTREEYERAATDKRFEFQKLIYMSDGLKVVVYVYKPRKVGEALPVIVFNRGSAVHGDIAPVLVPYFHRLASEGFVVVAPMYRQSDGGDGTDANGGDDVHDLLNILPVVRSLPYADAGNLFMTGESRGAMMVYQAIREGFPMRAAAVWGGYTDLKPMMDAQPALTQYAIKHWPGFEGSQKDVERRSAIYWPDAFNVPVLLMHGQGDRAVPVAHTYRLAEALQERDCLYGLIVFAGDDHVLSRNHEERDRASIAWFRRFDARAGAKTPSKREKDR